MNKTIAKKIVYAVFLLAVMVLCFLWQGSVIRATERVLPQVVEYRAQNGLNLTFNDISQVNRQQSELRVTGAATRVGTLVSETAPSETETVTLMMTDANFGPLAGFDLFLGSYFGVSGIAEENRVIALSDTLAVRFFGTDDVVGRTILLDGQSYLIGGIYRVDRSLVSRLSSNGLDIACLPYTEGGGAKSSPNLLLAKSSGSIRFLDNVTSQITAVTGKALNPDKVSNLTDTYRMVTQTRGVTVFLCGLLVIATLCPPFVRRVKRAFLGFVTEGGDRGAAVRSTVIAALLVLAAVLIFLLTKHSVYLPAAVMPDDNLFDIGHYIDQIVLAYQSKNLLHFYDFYWEFSFHAMVLAGVSSVFAFFSFAAAYANLYRLGKWALPQIDFEDYADRFVEIWRQK